MHLRSLLAPRLQQTRLTGVRQGQEEVCILPGVAGDGAAKQDLFNRFLESHAYPTRTEGAGFMPHLAERARRRLPGIVMYVLFGEGLSLSDRE
jgi:hypothetical protein